MKKVFFLPLLLLLVQFTKAQTVGMLITDSGSVKITTRSDNTINPVREYFQFEKNGSFFAKGDLGYGQIPIEGPGYRTMWHAHKAAFRSGYADNQWNEGEVGFFSWAGGYNSTAKGIYSFAFGDN